MCPLFLWAKAIGSRVLANNPSARPLENLSEIPGNQRLVDNVAGVCRFKFAAC
jgi:hypothetical protein